MLITKLNAKTNSFDVGGGGFGGISQSDIAAACSGLDALEIALIYYYWLGHRSQKETIRKRAESEMSALGSDFAEKLSHILVADLYKSTCSACNGTGYNRKNQTCGHCDGSGKKMLSERVLSKAVGMSQATFRRRHLEIYKRTFALLENKANIAAEMIKHKLG